MPPDLSRRGLLVAGALGAAGEPVLAASPGSASPGYDPRLSAEGQVKLAATLDGSPAFWAYSGVIYAVQPDRRPVAILALAGGQSSWAVRQADGGYRIKGAIVTFFRDPKTGAFLDSFDNPFTGRTDPVQPNLLSGGAMVFPADGASARAEGRSHDAVVAPGGFNVADPHHPLGAVRWTLLGPSVMLMTDHAWNVPVQPQLEAQTQIGDRNAFFDPAVRRMPATFTASTIVPWMAWMGMGAAPGHLVWHSSGEKLFSIDDMPADYRARAGALLERLASRPA